MTLFFTSLVHVWSGLHATKYELEEKEFAKYVIVDHSPKLESLNNVLHKGRSYHDFSDR